ncbi:MAG: type II toxin-antitoxin system VapC family toxin [candidate division NC10 bacterium]|nr:type II toxin-antitoxin system VapC family toxin [candidate division NC10 bacterium]
MGCRGGPLRPPNSGAGRAAPLQFWDRLLAISIISLAELYEGVHYSRNPAQSEAVLQRFLASVSVLPIDEDVCRIFGRERGKLRQEGKAIGDFDLLIASTCFCHDLTLCTNNRRHFEMVEGLRMVSQP